MSLVTIIQLCAPFMTVTVVVTVLLKQRICYHVMNAVSDILLTMSSKQWIRCSRLMINISCHWWWNSLCQCLAWFRSFPSTITVPDVIFNINDIMSSMAYIGTNDAIRQVCNGTGSTFVYVLVMPLLSCFLKCAEFRC